MFFDVVIHVVVIDRVPVDRAIGVNMGENMTMFTAFAVLSVILMGMAVRKAVVIGAGAPGRRL